MADILLIDDDELLRALVAMKFSAAGHVVRCAADGGEGLTMALATPPDAIVLDAMMPVMTGPEVFVRLRAEPALARVPVIMLSARNGASDVAGALTAGVADYVTKPFVPEELLIRVEAVLAARSRADAA